ncbi:MAG TPA: hypothetical protein VLD39_04335 [Gammaproteobacteria bacterium]|nr:hypothetical protein [Gammaproteobacteria bacterium]
MSAGEHDEHAADLAAIRRAYREAGFDDEPPPEVDAAVRAAAEHAVHRRYRQYLPPLALAATVVVALGLLLRIAALGPERPEPETQPELAPRALEPPAAPAATRIMAPAVDDTASMRAEEAFVTGGAASAPAVGDGPPEPDAAPPFCATPRPLAPDAWLACIAAALDAGSIDAARDELAAFEAAYPGYAVPSALTERLGPGAGRVRAAC